MQNSKITEASFDLSSNTDWTEETTFQWESLPEFYNEYMADLYAWMDHPLLNRFDAESATALNYHIN